MAEQKAQRHFTKREKREAWENAKRLFIIGQMRMAGISLLEIGEKIGISYERVRQILRGYKTDKGYKKPEITLPKNKYYCKRCEQTFWSRLPIDEAVCTKCGSEKITEN